MNRSLKYKAFIARRIAASLILLCLALSVLLDIGFLIRGVRINGDPPIVREYTIDDARISAPVSLVFLSDLHGCEHPTLIEQVKELEPDLILLGGDMINHRHETGEDILIAAAVVAELSKLAPVYYSPGNHELDRIHTSDRDAVRRVTDAGAIWLERKYVELELNGNRLRLGGMYTPNGIEQKPDATACLDFLTELCDTDAFIILMEHRPNAFTDAILPAGFEPELVLSGHLHGGHVILPLFGPVWGGSYGASPKYALGSYSLGRSTLIVSAGLSTQRHIIPRVNNPTEITKIILE